MKRIVVAGASLAGLRAAESLRANGFTGELLIIGAEPHEPYDRPPLSKAVLAGRLGTDHLQLPVARGLDADWRLGRPVTGLDLTTREVRIGDDRIGFDGLVVATGAQARPGPPGTHVVRTRDDADRLRRALAAGPDRVLVVGAGFTGSEVASSCVDLGLPVTVVHRGTTPMGSACGDTVGAVLGARHRAHGVDLRTLTTLTGLDGGLATLSDGTRLPVDVVVVATGSVPNTAWLLGSGVSAGPSGVDCDAACRVLDVDGDVIPGVYAAGDVARWRHPRFAAPPQRFEHWGNALDQADVAAHNLAGGPRREVTALPAFWSDQFGLNIKAIGLPHLAADVVLAQGSFERRSFVAVYGRGGITVGAVAVDSPRVLDGYAALITERAPFPPATGATDAPELVTVPGGQS
ncbi:MULTISPECIES: NAD(P)/FAD-dependent oxidoreductase [unclassified Amycolatopsis]|uniref:NAD(P)/FAD-dependent oxidoreductase n=1 Tax=unclassified Amycolatopsis TaxID=2618356 RepID=UPI002E0F76C6|nr:MULTISPECIES: FAD-dependent oxidoreductase [unclassified Amycolatopsis]WSK77636.1 FAD-dependent oxidoreductase [Amycolatopsis sp. NBC_01286]